MVAAMFGGIMENACSLATCIRYRHTDPSSVVMAWDAIEYMSRHLLFRIDSTLSSGRYISVVLRPVALPVIRALENAMF